MQKLPKKIKRINWKKDANDAYSLMVRTEAGFKCQFHSKLKEKGIPSPCSCNGVMQCCHKISRKKLSLLFDPRNTFCGCSGSNTWAHFNEPEWEKLWRKMWPEDVEYLESKKDEIKHFKNWDYKFMIDEYKKKIEELK